MSENPIEGSEKPKPPMSKKEKWISDRIAPRHMNRDPKTGKVIPRPPVPDKGPVTTPISGSRPLVPGGMGACTIPPSRVPNIPWLTDDKDIGLDGKAISYRCPGNSDSPLPFEGKYSISSCGDPPKLNENSNATRGNYE